MSEVLMATVTAPDTPPPVKPVPAVIDSISPDTNCQDVVLPSVCKYLPALPVWLGTT